MTLKQQKDKQQLLLLNDINYIIESILLILQEEKENNLYYLYNYYLNNKYDLIDNIYEQLKALKVDEFKEIATSKGFEIIKVNVNKHNLTNDNEYQTRTFIDELLKNKINQLIKDYKKEQKQKEFLYKDFIDNAECNNTLVRKKSKLKIMGLSPLMFIIANIIAICEAFGDTKKRR